MSPIIYVEYDYSEEDYADAQVLKEPTLDELYDEEEYGDYEEPFIEPPQEDYVYDDTGGPFGASSFNLDDIETSPIADVEYEYDYEDYNTIDDTPIDDEDVVQPTKENTPKEIAPKQIPTVKPKIVQSIKVKTPPVIYYNFRPVSSSSHHFSPPQRVKPFVQPIRNPANKYKFSPAELQYMYGKRQPKIPSGQEIKKKKPTNPLEIFVRKLQSKVEKILGFIRGDGRKPRLFVS